ncbi:MAG TPA: SynChlorMet cassette radical SAM/SPASM protein ScmE [Desulfobulbaceae bacterium]|nr:SynChlorMet cassette radical SAM/SPASM protein ScmE [Desulfobulbaceae bacterium]
MRSPRSVDIEITCRCNLRCSYCYYFDNPRVEYTELPAPEWFRFFEELGRAAVMDVCLVGGEPFLRNDLPQLLEKIVSNRMRFSILSNGTLIDETIAGFIHDTGRCNHVQISLDGSCSEVHATCRGDSFDQAVKGIRTLQKHHVPVTVRVTLHNRNIHDLDNIAVFLLDTLGLPGFTTNSAGYLGSCQKHPDLLLTTADREQAMAALLRLSKKYPGRISAQAGPLAEAQLWTLMEKARLENTSSSALPSGYLTGCGCPWTTLTVRADGSIVPCTMLSHLTMGRINQGPLEKVWRHHPILDSLRRRRDIPLSSFAFCRDCAYSPYCTGNCPGLAYSITGEIDQPSPDACLKRFLAAGGTLPSPPLDTSA